MTHPLALLQVRVAGLRHSVPAPERYAQRRLRRAAGALHGDGPGQRHIHQGLDQGDGDHALRPLARGYNAEMKATSACNKPLAPRAANSGVARNGAAIHGAGRRVVRGIFTNVYTVRAETELLAVKHANRCETWYPCWQNAFACTTYSRILVFSYS